MLNWRRPLVVPNAVTIGRYSIVSLAQARAGAKAASGGEGPRPPSADNDLAGQTRLLRICEVRPASDDVVGSVSAPDLSQSVEHRTS